MNKQIRDKWADALESGEYRQGRNYLHQVTDEGDLFCAVGVLCDLAHKEGAVNRTPVRSRDLLVFRYGSARHGAPKAVQDWAGLEDDYYVVLDDKSTVTSMNDRGVEFPAIAKEIRERL